MTAIPTVAPAGRRTVQRVVDAVAPSTAFMAGRTVVPPVVSLWLRSPLPGDGPAAALVPDVVGGLAAERDAGTDFDSGNTFPVFFRTTTDSAPPSAPPPGARPSPPGGQRPVDQTRARKRPSSHLTTRMRRAASSMRLAGPSPGTSALHHPSVVAMLGPNVMTMSTPAFRHSPGPCGAPRRCWVSQAENSRCSPTPRTRRTRLPLEDVGDHRGVHVHPVLCQLL